MISYNDALAYEGVTQTVNEHLSMLWRIDSDAPPHQFIAFYFNEDRMRDHADTLSKCRRMKTDKMVFGDDNGPVTTYYCQWIDYAPAFKAEHGINDEQFATNHWQVLFEIQYPEVRL